MQGKKGHTRPYKAIQGPIKLYKTIKDHSRPYKAIQGHTRPYKAMQGHTSPYKAIKGHNSTKKAMLIQMRPHIVMAYYQDPYVKTIRCHIKPYKPNTAECRLSNL